MADQAVLRFPVERAAALATGGQAATLRQGSDGADAGSAAPTPAARIPNAGSPNASANRITAIEAAGALAGMDLLQPCPSEPPAPQPAGDDPVIVTPRAAPASTVALVPLALDRPPAGAKVDLSPIPDRSAPNGDDRDGFETRALELVRGFWTGSGPPGDAEAGAGRDPATVGDEARDQSPAGAPLDAARLQDRDDEEFKERALALARSFWPGSEPPGAAEGGPKGVIKGVKAGADAAGDDAQPRHRAATPDAGRDPASVGGDATPARAVAAAPRLRRGLVRRGMGVAAGVVLAASLGVAVAFLTDRAAQIAEPEKAAGETAMRLAPPPPEVPAVAVPAAPTLAEVPAAAPVDPPRPQPAASSNAVAADRVIDHVAPASQPAPPPLILADVPPPEDAKPVILRPASASPASASPASASPASASPASASPASASPASTSPVSTAPVAQSPVPPAPVNDPVTILRAANPSPPVAPIQSIPPVASIRALPPILLTAPPDDDRGTGALVLHPLPPAAESAPPVERAPPLASASTRAQDSRPDGAASSLALVEPAARPAATAVVAPAPAPAAVPMPGPAPAERRPAIDPVQAAAMMRRADALAATGDFSGARLFYERLALAGDRQAALALARSYDPTWLRQQGVVGVPPDPARAAHWYARAAAAPGDAQAGDAQADQAPQAKP